MRTYHESDIRKRTLILAFVAVAWFIVLFARLVQIQVFDHAHYKAAVLHQSQDTIDLRPRRGNIYDRNGKILAGSVPAFTIGLSSVAKETPKQELDKIHRLKIILGFSEADAADALRRLKKGSYARLKRDVTEEQTARVKALVDSLKLQGVGIEAGHKRLYPLNSLAAHVLGGVNVDQIGQTGIEGRFDDLLSGKAGKQIVLFDRDKRGYQVQILKAPVPGGDITLTIDTTIQYIAECALARAVKDHDAAWGCVIICDPATGEILALANWPAYDVNEYGQSPEAWMNRAIANTYAPGSTFKIVTAASALENGVVRYSDVFDCSAGSITLGGLTIRDHEKMGSLTFPQVLIHSSNVGTVKLALRLAQADLYETIVRFGFGKRTGIELPAEEPGRVWPVAKWTSTSLPYIAIGYELRATPLQIVQAMNAYAVKGKLVSPRILKALGDLGAPQARDIGPLPSVIREETAAGLVSRVFKNVVEEGTGKDGKSEQFWIAGKTGTSQKFDSALGYRSNKYTASFVGFVPASRPVLTMIVVLDEPKDGFIYGGQICAPVFRDIASQVLRYLKVPPDKPFAGRVVTADLKTEDKS